MNRRTFMNLSLGSLLFASTFSVFAANDTPELMKQELDAGKTVFVDYAASWCSTCAAQMRVITQLRKENPAYDKNISFIKLDWDAYGSHEDTIARNIPRRSTLILLRGNKELGRIVAGTSKAQIKALLDKGL